MAAIREIVREWADEIRGGIAWVIIWKNGRSWNAQAVWLNPNTDTFEPEDMKLARKILEKDSKAIMVNGYYCGHLGENMTVTELAAGIRWHYENGYNTLDGSTAFSQEAEDEKEILTAIPQKKDIASQKAFIRQNSMDKLSLGFCEKLYVVNGFVTEIIAGHITRIGRETNLARMPPETGTAGLQNNKLHKSKNDQKGTGIQSGRQQKTRFYYIVSDAKNQ